MAGAGEEAGVEGGVTPYMARTSDLREMCVTDSSAARPVNVFSSKLTWVALIAGALMVFLGTFFCLLETRYSWSVISWQRKFEHDLTEKGEVRLADLVNFQWERIYIIDLLRSNVS